MRSLLSLSFAFLAVPAFAADDTYTIKLKIDADVGKTISYRTADVSTGSTKFFELDGKLLGEQKKESSDFSYRLTVLDRDKEGKATKFIRVYDKATEKEDGKIKTYSYQGRTLLFEKVAGKFRIGVVGTPPLDDKDVEKLLKEVNKKGDPDAMLKYLPPNKPVKVGDSWAVPVKPVAESMEDMPADLEKSKIAAKLTKVYKKGKSQFGSFEINIKLVLTSKKGDDEAVDFDAGSTLSADLTADLAIDGSSTERKEGGKMVLKGEGKMTAAGKKVRLVFDLTGDGGDDISAEVDDPKARVVPKVTFAAAPGEFVEFAAKDHGFQVKLPGKVEKKSDTNDRGITTTEYGVQTDGGRVYYSVTVTEYPPDKFKLDAATAYANLKKAPNIKESSDIKIGGFPAVELKQDIKKDVTMHLTQRVVIVGQRMYQLMTVVTDGRPVEAKQFFDSFKLDEKAIPKKDD